MITHTMSPLLLLFALLSEWVYDPSAPVPWGLTPLLIEERVSVVTDNSGTCVVVFRGTDSINDLFEDLIAQATSRCGDDKLLVPFTNSYNEIDMERVGAIVNGPPCRTNYLTGHSLGGAMATIAKVKGKIPGKVITFGEPRTCCGISDDGTRIVNKRDPIPALPVHSTVSHCADHGIELPTHTDVYDKDWPTLAVNYNVMDHRISHYITDLTTYINTQKQY